MRHTLLRASCIALGAFLFAAATPAEATTGWGCYRANVGPSDALKVRAAPSASAAVVATLHSGSAPIVALKSSTMGPAETLFIAHQREMATCTPSSLPLGARWCPVRLFDGGGMKEGFIKRRFVDHSECP